MTEVHHAVDERTPEPPRTALQILKELALSVPHLVLLTLRLLRDPRVPLRRKVVAVLCAGYVLSPIDLVPDALPVFGHVDDVIAVAFALDHLLRGVSADVQDEYWQGSEDMLDLVRAFARWGAELVPAPLHRLPGV